MEAKVKLEKSGGNLQAKSTRYREQDDEDDEERGDVVDLKMAGVGSGQTKNSKPVMLEVTASKPSGQIGGDMEDEEDDDLGFEGIEDCDGEAGSPEDVEFDRYVSAIQEVLVSDDFNEAVENFHRTHCNKFVETEENTHEMWTLHKKFKVEIEALLENLIKEQVPEYEQARFEKLCEGREGQLDEAVVDTLLAFDNFQEFKRQGLEVRLRQMMREEPERYKQVIATQQSYELVQQIHSLLMMEHEGITVCGKLGADDMY